MKMNIMDMPIRGGTKHKFFGPYASTSAERIKEYFGQYKPATRIIVTREIPLPQDGRARANRPVAANACILYISEPAGQALQPGFASTIWCPDGAVIRVTDGKTGQQADIHLPHLPKRVVLFRQLENLAHKGE